ncbi:MAG: nucleotidyl transferase AbiEii/AbiGii toxin family protein [Actinobacteria bacterium]|nr:nucleotidyl transferase AbiEii/AbiGii toxin family protein [Actinomycetota bacterium]
MIPEVETKRLGTIFGVDPTVVDQDYALGWMLAGLFSNEKIAKEWIFKGGTSLKKCWFPDYRFSVDLDFTVVGHLETDSVKSFLKESFELTANVSGINWHAEAPVFEMVSDEYGHESVQVRIYHRSSIRYRGSAQSIQIDLSRDEFLAFPPVKRTMYHPYSDTGSLPLVSIPCYTLEEVLAEKLRAVGGQRRYALARDVYDIHQLSESGVDIKKTILVLDKKFEAKGLELHSGIVDDFVKRKADYELDWDHHVRPLEAGESAIFEDAFQKVADLLERVLEAYSS